MIIKTTNIDELNKIVRNTLIEQSQLEPIKIVNGVSIHGQDLIKRINDYVYKSYEPQDALIVFDLQSRDSSNSFSQTKDNNTISYYMSYAIHLMIYGNSSPTMSNLIASRLRTEYVRDSLQYQGVYLESVSNPTIGNDFINNSMHIRCDMFINISCQMEISQVVNNDDFNIIDLSIEEI